MFCTNCGAQLEDNSIFCIQCGARVAAPTPVEEVSESVSATVCEQPEVTEATPVVEAVPVVEETPVVEAAPVVETEPTPVQPTFANQIYNQVQQPAFNQPYNQAFEQSYNQMQQPFGGQPYAQNVPYTSTVQPKKKVSKALIPAILFAIISIAASVMVCLYGFKTKELGMGLENIAFALTAIFVIVYAVSKSGATSIMKSVGFIAVAALHTIYYGVAAGKEATTLLTSYFGGNSNANLTDCYYGIILVLGLVALAVYLLMNIIKGFMNSKKASMGMLVSGYFAMLLIIVCFVVDFASDKRGLFAFKFVPVDLGLVALILADIFATIARAKKFED